MKPVIEILTKELALQMVKEQIEEKGKEYKYQPEGRAESCKYLHGVTTTLATNEDSEDVPSIEKAYPACLIGCALVKHGVPMLTLLPHNVGVDASSLLYTLEEQGVIGRVESGARAILSTAQNVQDQSHTWSEALKRAQSEYNYYSKLGND